MLTVVETGGREAAAGGDIVTIDQYASFELIVEYNITKGANSGVKYFVDTELNKGEGSSIGCEFQILDDAEHPDAKAGVNGNRRNAGLYDLIPPQNLRFKGVGEWNRARIVARGPHVEHWLNGFKTVEYERGTQMWRALVDHSKYVVWPSFGEAPRGHSTPASSGRAIALANSSPRPPKRPQVTKAPTARKASSLTTDSAAIAATMPSWRSLLSSWRVPKSTVNAASASAT